MKRTYLIAVVLLTILAMSSCSVPLKNFKATYIVDYNRYAKAGFFLTESESVSFDYEPVGSMVSIVAGEESTEGKKTKDTWGRNVRDMNIYDGLDEIVRASIGKGANGLIGLKIRMIYYKDYGKGFEITGMAVKRKGGSSSSYYRDEY